MDTRDVTDRPEGDSPTELNADSPDTGNRDNTAAGAIEGGRYDRALSELQRQVHDVLNDDGRDPAVVAQRLSQVEQQLLDLSEKIEQAEAGAIDSDVVIADVEEWASLCDELGQTDEAEAARRLIRDFHVEAAGAWKKHVERELDEPTADVCFQRLLETTSRRCEAARADERVVDDDLFAGITDTIRQTFRERLDQAPPSPETRRRWSTDLSDYVDLVLTTIDELPPDKTAGELALIEETLRWHLRHVERASGLPRRQLRRKLARVRAELQERHLQHRLERRFGRRFVAFSERLILFLICLVVVLMTIETFADLSSRTKFWFTVVDSCACFIFLVEFFTKLSLVRGRARWFRRHFLIDFVPSIPLGLLLGGLAATNADAVRYGRLARFLRLPRLARYVRVLRPLLRLLRALGLLARGLDRLARRYAYVLNQNVILYPTRAELDRATNRRMSQAVELEQLRGRLRDCWKQLLISADDGEQPAVAGRRLESFRTTFDQAIRRQSFSDGRGTTYVREIPAGTLIERFESSTPQSITEEFGDELVAQLARLTRIFARAPLRWIPVIRSCVPMLTDDMSHAEITAAAAQRIAVVIKKFYNAWFWVADLYGTVTPSQFVGRVGTMLVNSSSRPAYRLLLFGGFFLITDAILWLTALSVFRPLRAFLYRFIGTTVMVIGGVCFLILGVGFWLKRVAREATEFYEQSVQAQFLSLTEVIRTRHLQRDAEILYDRVLRPAELLRDEAAAEQREEHLRTLLQQMEQGLLGTQVGSGGCGTEGRESMLFLYRDWLDGAILTDTDTRTTSQLLGNPAIRQLLNQSGRFDRKQLKALQRLDLVRQKSLFSGPYLWFNFISRSIAHSVAKLLVDFNQNAVPLDDLPRISAADRERYDHWLQETAHPPLTSERKAEGAATRYITTSFTALHFLDFDEQRDREVERRFGTQVLARLQADRSLMIRRIFGTYPMHDRPKDQRVVNLYALYNSWLAGGRALLLPWFLLGLVFRLLWAILMWMGRSVKEIRRPELRANNRDAARAHFYTAIRKIERIRGPVVAASLRLRMKIDPEYLGAPFPGRHRSTLGPADVDADLRFLNADPATMELVGEERQRALEDMQRLQSLIDDGLLERVARGAGLPDDAFHSQEHIRAAAVAYLSDYADLRRHLSAFAILESVLSAAVDRPPPREGSWPRPLLKRKFNRYWRQFGNGGRRERGAAWRAIQSNVRGAADALRVWDRLREEAAAEGEKRLAEVLLHPGRMNEQLMAVRVVQTLAVLDVLNYRDHIYQLGRYASMGDQPGRLLEWNTTLRN